MIMDKDKKSDFSWLVWLFIALQAYTLGQLQATLEVYKKIAEALVK